MSIRIDILAYEGCVASSAVGPLDLFRTANQLAMLRRRSHAPPFELSLCTIRGKPVISSCGVQLAGPAMSNRSPHVLFVPALDHSDVDTLVSQLTSLKAEITALSTIALRKITFAAPCSGAFLLGESGVLNGRHATTSWWLGESFRKRYPRVVFKPERVVVKDGPVLTAGAESAYLDLSINLVNQYAGPDLARQVASVMLIDPRRQSQAPYVIDALSQQPREGALERADRWLLRHLHEKLTVEDVAARSKVSARTLLRRVRHTHGVTFVAHVQTLRTDRAKSLLETTHLGFAEIAERCGYSDPGAFRKVFRARMGMSPRAYRERFSLRRD